jgi:hypothetical protein
METTARKTCKICYQEIDSRAKKCPYCHHWQRPWLAISYSPVIAALPVAVMLLAFGILLNKTFSRGEPFELHRADLQIKEAQMTFGNVTNCGPTVAVLGTFKNAGRFSWKDINVEVQFFGADGKLIDGGQRMQYALEAPAGGEAVFKVSMKREFPQESYKDYKIRILSAKDNRVWP